MVNGGSRDRKNSKSQAPNSKHQSQWCGPWKAGVRQNHGGQNHRERVMILPSMILAVTQSIPWSRLGRPVLGLGAWSFFGVWSLKFGVSLFHWPLHIHSSRRGRLLDQRVILAVMADPEPDEFHSSLQRPSRKSRSASSARASSRPARTSASSCRSHASASNAENHLRKAARSPRESLRTAASIP